MPVSKRLHAVFLAFAMLLLAACSGGKPESVVENFYRAAAKGDLETATKQISFANVPAAQMMQAKGKVQMIVGEMQSRIRANDGLDSITAEESKIEEDGQTARVRTKLKFRNGKEMTESHRLIKENGDWKISLK